QHGIKDGSALGGDGREYDCCIYSIIKFFQLVMENNPNMIDSLFVPQNCIVYSTPIGQMVREARHLFLHKGSWHKFKG
ncbi:DNA polymerase beta superfamily protein, partial [Escherichia coli]|uniref:DNA polymerase beta superfamily protein n=1 Tax=Escherichia coli TaxID=562 RepID=UPI003CE5BB27